jgi:hypothetical protein
MNVDGRFSAQFMALTNVPVRLSLGVQAETVEGVVNSSFTLRQQMHPGSSLLSSVPGNFVGPGRVVLTAVNRGAFHTAVTLRATQICPGT